ncbi:hypothetical protein GOV14_00835 [Candidatus Pacearchaeota archaeon]|nr:hypothetical protein [Candidatus Pacearchaeota archaeon]
MEEQSTVAQDPITELLTEFGTRLNEIEEKQRLVKDRALLIGENLVSIKEGFEEDIIEMKKQLKESDQEIKAIKQLNKRIVNELSNFARKTEVDILKRQMSIFNPLEIVKKSEVERIISEEIRKKLSNN